MKRIFSLFKSLWDRVVFLLKYPYASPEKIYGLAHMKLPFLFRGGKMARLCVENSSLKTEKNIEIQSQVWLGYDVEISTSQTARVVVKAGTSIQDRCKIIGNVTLERGCILAPQVFISSGTHNAFDTPELTIREQDRLGPDRSLMQYNHIEEDCWIGYNVFVKHGVYIGRGAVVGANATILKDVGPYEVVAGHHRIIKKRLEFSPPSKIEFQNTHHRPYFYRGIGDQGQILDQENLFILQDGKKTTTLVLKGSGLSYIHKIVTSEGCFELFENHEDVHIYKKKQANESLKLAPVLSNYMGLSIKFSFGENIKIEALEVK